MAKRRYISDNFWSDNWISELDPLEKYLYMYLLTNQFVGICGIYEIQLKRIAFDTGIDKEMIEKMLKRFEESGKVFYKYGIIFIVNFVKNQSIKTTQDNLRKGIEREVKELGIEKLSKVLLIEGAYKVVEGAYKDVPIPYSTLLYSTIPNSTGDFEVSEDVSNYPSSDQCSSHEPATARQGIQGDVNRVKNMDFSKKVVESILEYNENRKKKLQSLKDKGLEIFTKQLKELGENNDDKMIAILEQSIVNGWQGIFPLRSPSKKNKTPETEEERLNELDKMSANYGEKFKEKYGVEKYKEIAPAYKRMKKAEFEKKITG